MVRILGWVEEVTECDCCGKSDLSGTFAVEIDGATLHYGSTCATRNTGIKNPKSAAEAYRRERQADAVARIRQTDEYRAYRTKLDVCTAMVDRKEIQIGVQCREFVRAEAAAYEAVAIAISAQFKVGRVYA